MKNEVEISVRAKKQIQGGSLWVFSNEIKTSLKQFKPGEWVDFLCQGQFVGFGYINPHSLIAGRICSLVPVSDRKELLKHKLQSALEKRKSLSGLGSFRGVFAESDQIPGLVVDVFGKVVVAQSNTCGIDEAKSDWTESLLEILDPEALLIRGDSSVRSLEKAKAYKEIVRGEKSKLEEGRVQEGDLTYSANFYSGQKTGFFLDQRNNRWFLRDASQGKRVLDLFSYSGGWGLNALRGGAEAVTFVDQSSEALSHVRKGLEINNLSAKKTQIVEEDVFDYLKSCSEKFDIVVCDPPAFVKTKKDLKQAMRAYLKLNSQALRVLNSGCLLFSSSCSYHLSESDFEDILREALAQNQVTGQVVYRGNQAQDHPWILNRPESRYLKCYALRIG